MTAPETTADPYSATLHAVLDEALANVPFYQKWRECDPGPSHPAKVRFAALPHVTKRDIRAHMPKGFVPRSRSVKAGLESGTVELVSTSGTTDDRSSILWDQSWWDASEHAAATLHTGLDRVINGSQREAVLTTPLCAGTVCHVGDLPLADRTMGRLLFLNQQADPGRWKNSDMDRMLGELDGFQPELLEADPAYLAILCRYAADTGRSVFKPRYISLTYEFPSRLHLRQIRRAFPDTPTLSSYGSTETGHLLTECEHGSHHQNTRYCHLDVQPFKRSHGLADSGRLLVTTLGNTWVSLLRFDIGDLVQFASLPCPCGRADGLTVARVLGRVRDLTFTTTGRAVPVDTLDRVVGGTAALVTYQLEQIRADEYCFHYVSAPGFTAPLEALDSGLRGLYGAEARITLREESTLPTEQSGKFRLARTCFPWSPGDLFEKETPLA